MKCNQKTLQPFMNTVFAYSVYRVMIEYLPHKRNVPFRHSSKALLRMLERFLSIYTGPDSFLYTNFPVYKLSRVAFFRYSLLPPKQFSTPFALKHCPQRKPFKTLGNTAPSKALLRMLERRLSIYTGPDSFPNTNFPVYKLSRVAFFRHSLLPQKQF